MRLSEAIRLGALLGPQAYGPRGLCVGNAALAAIGKPEHENGCSMTNVAVCREWLWLRANSCACPHCGESVLVRDALIEHLNDDHRWTRERIADWVATVEPQETPSAEIVRQPEPSLTATAS